MCVQELHTSDADEVTKRCGVHPLAQGVLLLAWKDHVESVQLQALHGRV